MPPGPWRMRSLHEDIKVPVVKNIIYGIKMTMKCDPVYLIAKVIDDITYLIFTSFVQGVLFLKVLLNIIEGNNDYKYYVKTVFIFLACGFLYELISCVCDYILHISEKKILKQMNNMIYKKALEVDVSCYENPEFYDKYKRATDVLTNSYIYRLSNNFATIIASAITFALTVGLVASIDPIYLLFLIPVVFVFFIEIKKGKVLYKRDYSMVKNYRTQMYVQRTMFLRDYSKDMRTSNIFSIMMRRYNNAVKENIYILKNYGFKLFFYSMLSSVCSELIPVVGTYSTAAYQFTHSNTLSISDFSVVISSVNTVRQASYSLSHSISMLSNDALYFQNLYDFFHFESKITDGPLEADDFESIEFKNVTFTYPGAKEPSLKNINFKINKGQTVAIVGVNGAGKSTLVKLLLRFYDADSGEILYNGRNIKEYTLDSLRRKYATVFQDYKTFAISVNENVICHECDEYDKQFAETALKKSGVFEKVQTLPQGADTVLTREFDENGVGLSGGENQKTAVARMFARDFDIAILDEPSSALDPVAEYKMYENLIDGTKDKTVIYISHRLSSAVLSDNIFVLGNKTVLESGSHQELMATGGQYSKMFELQASSYKGGGDNE